MAGRSFPRAVICSTRFPSLSVDLMSVAPHTVSVMRNYWNQVHHEWNTEWEDLKHNHSNLHARFQFDAASHSVL